jgi:hypothetical protein
MSRRITITITVPDDVEVSVETAPPSEVGGDGLATDVLEAIRRYGPNWAEWEEKWARWAADEAGAVIVRAASTTQPGRIRGYPAAGPRRGFAGLYAPSGRLAFPNLPHDLADGDLIKPIWNEHQDGSPRTPAGVAVRLHSDEGVEAAKRLTLIALNGG